MRKILITFLLLGCVSASGQIIDSVKTLSPTISKYRKFELGVAVSVMYKPPFVNPYDSSSVDMYAIFTAPSGKKYRRNAFWYEPYTRFFSRPNNVVLTTQDSCDRGWDDVIEKQFPDPDAYIEPLATNYNWRIRFAPSESGTWTYKVFARTSSDSDSYTSYSFTVSISNHKGYVAKTPGSRYFQYRESNETFIPLGLNVYRREQQGDTYYNRIPLLLVTRTINSIAPYGANLMRVWMAPVDFRVEMKQIGNYGQTLYQPPNNWTDFLKQLVFAAPC